jgi:hypothetical protein
MKKFLAVLAAAVCAGACAAQPVQRVADLRRVLEQYHPASAPRTEAPPRELSAEERAQLRRQLADFKQAATKRPTTEGSTTR